MTSSNPNYFSKAPALNIMTVLTRGITLRSVVVERHPLLALVFEHPVLGRDLGGAFLLEGVCL